MTPYELKPLKLGSEFNVPIMIVPLHWAMWSRRNYGGLLIAPLSWTVSMRGGCESMDLLGELEALGYQNGARIFGTEGNCKCLEECQSTRSNFLQSVMLEGRWQ